MKGSIMSQTPETDRVMKNCSGWHHVPIEHARKLERERSEAREALRLALELVASEARRSTAVLKERDDAREKIQKLNSAGTQYAAGWDDHVIASRAKLNQLRAELDEARQCALREGADGGALAAAAREHLACYLFLANSGDVGNWDPEQEQHVIALRAALKAYDRRAAPLSARPTKGEGEGCA